MGQIAHKIVLVFINHIFEGITDLVEDAALDESLGKHGLHGLAEAGQAIHAGNEDVLDPTRLQIAQYPGSPSTLVEWA